ncbi:DUF4839 domain-containing protein [Streptomyces sp. NPDC048606]|uniref:DUF4839 domain-containing protein n=1 Tax=Streptomyces sp. NPDC048606 TaxID=3154726 RepID=UPI0034334F24
MADEITYEHKTVKAVRGTDGRVISKMREEGWELVEQSQGKVRTTLEFRRPKKPLPRALIVSVAGGFVLLAVVIGIGAALEGGGDAEGGADKPSVAGASAAPSAPSTPTAAAPPAPSAAAEVITTQNSPEFAALLKTPDSCDQANQDFATKHAGRTIAFDGSIVNVAPHGSYDTRYDFLLGPGDKGAQTGIGPAFKYEDVNVPGLKLTGPNTPETVRAGDTFRFVARVGEFRAKQCLFLLTPVSTEPR